MLNEVKSEEFAENNHLSFR